MINGGNDDDYFAEHPNLTDHFIETYIETYNDRIPNLRKHIATKAKQNFGELGAVMVYEKWIQWLSCKRH